MRIERLTNDLIRTFETMTVEQRLPSMRALRRTLDRFERLNQSLIEKHANNDKELNRLVDEISNVLENSMADSFVRKQIEDLIRERKDYLRKQERIKQLQDTRTTASDHLQQYLVSNFQHDPLFKDWKQRCMFKLCISGRSMHVVLAITTTLQSPEYERRSERISPQLLALHKLTSGQTVMSASPDAETKSPQPRLTENFVEPKTQLVQTKLIYLQTEQAEAIATSDLAQQIAIERAIHSRIQMMQETAPLVDLSQTSVLSSATREPSLPRSDIEQEIPSPPKTPRKRLEVDEINSNDLGEPLVQEENLLSNESHADTTHEIEELRQLNNRSQDDRFLDREKEETLPDHSLEHKQSASLIRPFDASLSRGVHTQLLPSAASRSSIKSPFTAVIQEQRHEGPAKVNRIEASIIEQQEPIEEASHPVMTTDTEALYQELEKMRYSIETALENIGLQRDSNGIDGTPVRERAYRCT